MQRYFVEQLQDDVATVSLEDARHIRRVMRMETGDEVIAVYEGVSYRATVQLQEDSVFLQCGATLSNETELPVKISIVSGLSKGKKLDWIAQKGTELGMFSFYPVEMERSVVLWNDKKREKNEERLQKIAKEAAEQSHRTVVPSVEVLSQWADLERIACTYTHRFFAYEVEANEKNRQTIADHFQNVYHGDSVLVVFGPEGGISEKEVEWLRTRQFIPISLGPRILRTETAPLYVLSAASYEFEGK